MNDAASAATRPASWRTTTGVRVALGGQTDEGVLLSLIARDDEQAFAYLYDRHVVRVYAHCVRQLGSAQDADDLTSVVFLEAWRRRKDIRVVSGSALPWLLLTATNVARNHRRSLRRYRSALSRIPAPGLEPDHAPGAAARADAVLTQKALSEALAQLSPMDRQVVSLCLIGGLTYGEAAEALGLSHASVRSRLMRSRRSMRGALANAGITGPGQEEIDV